ncbi:hypothetical protein Ade02nite_35880 [Paractinoplanes deccanensis]|uniref:Uncharacterized protein n=1 Tax=Paractinoplanes deccanensis TaxID=113561 RepID=A0ABQ3Y4Q0_9ACTN|nr:hypothetical protein [Actinoplanes deccanensis]GID74947.1 hypothetical protein Ade02nite_35880 [Actinoplanes deccanensis]
MGYELHITRSIRAHESTRFPLADAEVVAAVDLAVALAARVADPDEPERR